MFLKTPVQSWLSVGVEFPGIWLSPLAEVLRDYSFKCQARSLPCCHFQGYSFTSTASWGFFGFSNADELHTPPPLWSGDVRTDVWPSIALSVVCVTSGPARSHLILGHPFYFTPFLPLPSMSHKTRSPSPKQTASSCFFTIVPTEPLPEMSSLSLQCL